MDPIVFLGSLGAILALTGVSRWLGLGRGARLASEADARMAANEAMDGFEPAKIAIDQHGEGALMEDRNGRLLLLKPHGNFFAARPGSPAWAVEQDDRRLIIDSGERRFGRVALLVDDPAYWVAAIGRLRNADHA